MITKDKAIDIIQKFEFFQGQRAGRELWSEKEFSVQEADLVNFRQDCYDLLEYLMNTEVATKAELEKCSCFRDQGTSTVCYGTREQDYCSCGGDESKCNFYTHVRERAAAKKTTNKNAFVHLQWNSRDVSPVDLVTNNDKYPDILVCYMDNGEVQYKTFKYIDSFTPESKFIKEHAVAWCFINEPENLISKEAAIKTLQQAGIFDKNGNLMPVYECIIKKVDNS